jgi:hypothetical protein
MSRVLRKFRKTELSKAQFVQLAASLSYVFEMATLLIIFQRMKYGTMEFDYCQSKLGVILGLHSC